MTAPIPAASAASRRSTFRAACAVEARKTAASRVPRTATVLIVVGITAIATVVTGAADNGNEQIVAKLGTIADSTGWDLLLGVAGQVTAAAALLGFGVVLSWLVGREFTDGTLPGLFAMPVPLRTTAAAKMLVYLTWAAAVAITLAATLSVAGLLIGLDAPPVGSFARQVALTLFTAGLATPSALASTLGRGLLTGITVAISIVVIAQIAVIGGAGGWMPVAAPALWTLQPDQVSAIQLALALAVPVVFATATLAAWKRLQLDH